MGLTTFGYPEISNLESISGNSLRFYVSGGETAANEVLGTLVYNKSDYLNLENPDASGLFVGSPYFYFSNGQGTYDDPKYAFEEASGSNRMSIYIHTPPGLTNGTGGAGNSPDRTMNIGPYVADTGGHWYHNFYNEGEGWAHLIIEGHPQHNNAWSNATYYPYPSSSLRNMDTYISNLYKFYFTFTPYGGVSTVPFSIYIDNIEFFNDSEPQNNETINSPAITYHKNSETFEIGFNDKYKNDGYSYSTYEMRYSFDPITNANWSSATPVHVLADSRYHTDARSDGKFAKWWPYYQAVWAPFELATGEDTSRLTSGIKIYFAIKDISQAGGDSQTPMTGCGIGNWNTCGRDYANHGDTFDYAGDQPVLNLIKRMDYQIAQDGESDAVPPASPQGLAVS